jgi:hypothetical protein
MYQVPFGEHIENSSDIFCNNTITTGVSMQYDNYIETFIGNPYNANIVVPGIFAEYSFDLIEHLKFVAGIRADFADVTQLVPTADLLTNPYQYNKTFLSPRIHIKYNLLNDKLILAASAGKGYRVPRPIEENPGYLASNREFYIDNKLAPEEAWNYGANLYYSFDLFTVPFELKLDYYRTNFINQMVVDWDKDVNSLYFYNLNNNLFENGKSYSNAYQIDITAQPFLNFFITAAYRYNDVKITTAGIFQQKALQSPHKAFLNFQYNTEMNEWAFDLTLDYNGKGRIPNQVEMYSPYFLLNAQVTRSFGNLDIYIGGENLTNYMIPDAIRYANTPFATGFDASMIYGPVNGMSIYLGLRYKIY